MRVGGLALMIYVYLPYYCYAAALKGNCYLCFPSPASLNI